MAIFFIKKVNKNTKGKHEWKVLSPLLHVMEIPCNYSPLSSAEQTWVLNMGYNTNYANIAVAMETSAFFSPSNWRNVIFIVLQQSNITHTWY